MGDREGVRRQRAKARDRERERTTERELDKQPSGRRQIENSGMAVKVMTSLRLYCNYEGI